MWRPKACPRCRGDMYSRVVDDQEQLACLQCGHEIDVEAPLFLEHDPRPVPRTAARRLPSTRGETRTPKAA